LDIKLILVAVGLILCALQPPPTADPVVVSQRFFRTLAMTSSGDANVTPPPHEEGKPFCYAERVENPQYIRITCGFPPHSVEVPADTLTGETKNAG